MTTMIETTEANNERKGYPTDLKEIKYGQMSMPAILEGASVVDAVSYDKSAHNEVTITRKDGGKTCRLRETNIVTLHPDGQTFLMNTGGWPTVTTRRHMADFLNRNLPSEIRVGVSKRGDTTRLYVGYPDGGLTSSFKQWIVVTWKDGQPVFLSDITHGGS